MGGAVRALTGGLALAAGAGLTLAATPLLDPDLSARPRPAAGYDEASERVRSVLDAEAALPLLPEGRSVALLHGVRRPTAVVMFHGFTAAPEQFRVVARGFHDAGHNVWVPRLPGHGEADPLSTALSRLTSEGLRAFADAAIDAAAGLGERVWVLGLSAGGTLALWAALARRDVDRATLISPLLLPAGHAAWELGPVVRALRLAPRDVLPWWDPALRDRGPRAFYYPRYSLKGVGAVLGLAHWAESQGAAPGAEASVLLVRNDGDPRLNLDAADALLGRLVPPARLRRYRIPATEQLGHDLVCVHPLCENYPRIRAAYRHLSAAFGVDLPDPLG